MIQRKIQNELLKLLKRKEIIALIGARQVGKTTLMKWLFEQIKSKKKQFISFEMVEIISLFETDLEQFIELFVKPYDFVFIDEFQYSKTGGQKLKRIYDEFGTKIIISGSSVADLSIHSLQYLVGRVLIVDVNHFSFWEFLNYKDSKLLTFYDKGFNKSSLPFVQKYFEEFILYGGYPEVIKEPDFSVKQLIISSLINTYLLKEVRDILQYKNLFEFEKVLEITSINLGQLLNRTGLSSDLGISRFKLDEVLSLLEKTFVINLLRPITSSKVKDMIKSPKVYFYDSGFRNNLVQNFNKLAIRSDKGFLYENFVLTELLKAGFTPQFYNYKNSSEVDFVIDRAGQKIAFEIKSSLHNTSVERSISGFIKKVKPDKIYILNENIYDERVILGTKVFFTHIINLHSILKDL